MVWVLTGQRQMGTPETWGRSEHQATWGGPCEGKVDSTAGANTTYSLVYTSGHTNGVVLFFRALSSRNFSIILVRWRSTSSRGRRRFLSRCRALRDAPDLCLPDADMAPTSTPDSAPEAWRQWQRLSTAGVACGCAKNGGEIATQLGNTFLQNPPTRSLTTARSALMHRRLKQVPTVAQCAHTLSMRASCWMRFNNSSPSLMSSCDPTEAHRLGWCHSPPPNRERDDVPSTEHSLHQGGWFR